jgi:hypothetical protein
MNLRQRTWVLVTTIGALGIPSVRALTRHDSVGFRLDRISERRGEELQFLIGSSRYVEVE